MSKQQPSRAKYPKKITLAMTAQMYADLLRLAGERRRVPGLVRRYLAFSLDHQAEIAGSRRYFTGRFRDAVVMLMDAVRWYLTLNTILLAEGLSIVILGVYDDLPEEERQQFSGAALLRFGLDRAAEVGQRVQERVQELIDDAAVEKE